jgi:hypothetical protein
VSFLRACGGQAYYHDVVDLAASPPPAFPQLAQGDAVHTLGGEVELVWSTSPFTPAWRRVDGTACVAATAAAVPGCAASPPATP